jgi:SAM-dependent methyltransferase
MTRPITLDEPSAYFDRLAAFEAEHWWSAAMWRVAAHWLDVALLGRSGLAAVDIGCGAGLTLERLASRREVARVVGIDPSPEALAFARRRGHRAIEASAMGLPFEEGSFDVATCLDVIQHLPRGDVRQCLDELARVLRPGGVAVVRTNAGRDGVDSGEPRMTFEAAGFEVRRASRVNAVGSLAQEVRGRLRPSVHRVHPSGGGLPASSPGRIVGRIMGAIGGAEAFAVGRLGWRLPFGHSAMLMAIRRPV